MQRRSGKVPDVTETLDLERFVRVVRSIPSATKTEIDKIIAESKIKYPAKPVPERQK